MASHVKVSACLIVKDEEANLARCLRSLQGKVDEIVLVDTGSTDNTLAIAREFGIEARHFAWCDDFSAARNESIRHASGDWVLWIDADEELMERKPNGLRWLCSQPAAPNGFTVGCHSLRSEDGDVSTIIQQWRLFKNGQGMAFEGRIHEHLVPPDGSKNATLTAQEVVWIRHWGYMPVPEIMERKRARNFPLIRLAIEDNPEDAFARYNLGKQYAAEHNFAPALEALDVGIKLWTEQGQIPYAYAGNMFALAINAAVELGQNERALELEALTPAHCITSDVLFQTGVAHSRLKHYDMAISRLQRAWSDPDVPQAIESDPTNRTWRPLSALAHVHMELGKPGEAYEFAKQGYGMAPTRPNILYALAFIAARLNLLDDSVKWSRELIAGELDEGFKAQVRRILYNIGSGTQNPGLMVEAFSGPVEGIAADEAAVFEARARKQVGDAQGQYDVLDAACKRFPERHEIRLELATVLDENGFVAEAVNLLSAGLDQPTPPADLYERLGRLLAKQGRLDDAANAFDMWTRLRESAAPAPAS